MIPSTKLFLLCTILVYSALNVYAHELGLMGTPNMRPPREFFEQCREEIDITSEEIRSQDDRNIEKRLCFSRCIFMKEGLINDDGSLNIEHFKDKIRQNPSKASELDAIISCLESVGTVPTCEDMTQAFKCIHQ